MTPEHVREEVRLIERCKGDSEAAHCMEKALWRSVLSSIATGNAYAREVAAEALTTSAIDFDRWYA